MQSNAPWTKFQGGPAGPEKGNCCKKLNSPLVYIPCCARHCRLEVIELARGCIPPHKHTFSVVHTMFHALSLYRFENEEDHADEERERRILIMMGANPSLGKGHGVRVLAGSSGHALL